MCGCPTSTEFEFYPLKGIPTTRAPQTISALKNWLDKLGKDWDGKIYIATSIFLKNDEFRQSGCSPNYMAGWWSLACCKHKMLASCSFKEKVLDQKPTYIFTLAKNSDGKHWLVSVARITNPFETMKKYADFLRTKGKKLLSSRLSREFQEDGMRGWRFGDCHANSAGKIGRPYKEHVHAKGDGWKDDCPETNPKQRHLIVVSDDYIVWRKPTFKVRNKARNVFRGPKGAGVNIDQTKLTEFLEEI